MNSNEQNQLNLLLGFEGIADDRVDRKKLYPLNEVLFLTISAVISGYSKWGEVVDFGKNKLAWLGSYLPYCNGIPSDATVSRMIPNRGAVVPLFWVGIPSDATVSRVMGLID